MTFTKDLAQLGKLIATSHGWPAAKAFKAYKITDKDSAVLSTCAVNLLKIFPRSQGDGTLISAAFAVQLEQALDAPIHVVAGTLTVKGEPVFGGRSYLSGAATFGTEDHDGDSHVWVMVGANIVDISLFRTAYSPSAPVRLSRHIDLTFGPNKGLYVDHWKRTKQLGLGYEPQYVLNANQVTDLMGSAYRAIRKHQEMNTNRR